jgi:hypothetical protein
MKFGFSGRQNEDKNWRALQEDISGGFRISCACEIVGNSKIPQGKRGQTYSRN